MSFHELAWKRSSVRGYKPDDVSMEKITRLLDAARSAPSAGNCQPWYFYVVRDAAMKKRLFETAGGRQPFMLEAPVMIVVCVDYPKAMKRYGERGRDLYCIQDTAAAIQNLLLCAVDEGLAACWCGAFDEKPIADLLELSVDLRPIAVIPVGYAVTDPPKTPRRPIEEICTFIGFDGEALPQSGPAKIKIEHRDMGGALFNDLNLQDAEFVDINMRGASFHDLNLAGAKIERCDLTDVQIADCRIDGLTVNGKAVSELLSD